MDIFGISDAVCASADSYFKESHATGRTARMLELLKPGDRVVCHSWEDHRQMHKVLARLNLKDVLPVLVPVDKSHHIVTGWPAARGVTYFTHEWLEAYWLHEMGRIKKDLQQLSFFSSYQCIAFKKLGLSK
ncbi:hypothetical protein K1Y77_17070 (plasmid) [Halomonas qaidamensis]|uniref:Uncharacterized protein n=1 Tax=Halomonas qaidamensis TaxID=2866211 RepID=A0ABY6JUJ5_9GAMM|nr:hypothetical protein [Halomonas qaidamensis]UYV20931.1 hypothetical protein K1Y77_17070 [Halomonas qaidamensis]